MAPLRGRVASAADFGAMIDAGLGGLEVAHRDNPDESRAILMTMAAEHDLIVTGSSAVSYTHLDVYKRQGQDSAASQDTHGAPGPAAPEDRR